MGEIAFSQVTVLGDEVVSVRPLHPHERDELRRAMRERLWAISTILVGLAALLIPVALSASYPGWLVTVVAVGTPAALLHRSGLHWFQLRRDRSLGKMLVLASARGRVERLAASGRLWRRGEEAAPWRLPRA